MESHARANDDPLFVPAHDMADLMRQVLLVRRLERPAPAWMVDDLRAAGIDPLATAIEGWNRRLDHEPGRSSVA